MTVTVVPVVADWIAVETAWTVGAVDVDAETSETFVHPVGGRPDEKAVDASINPIATARAFAVVVDIVVPAGVVLDVGDPFHVALTIELNDAAGALKHCPNRPAVELALVVLVMVGFDSAPEAAILYHAPELRFALDSVEIAVHPETLRAVAASFLRPATTRTSPVACVGSTGVTVVPL